MSNAEHQTPLLEVTSDEPTKETGGKEEKEIAKDASFENRVASAKSPSKHRRLASLDIMRGFTMVLMLFVDGAGTP